jgi:hypothetical protein
MDKITICKDVIARIQKEIPNFEHLSKNLPYSNDAHKKAVEITSFELLKKDIELLQQLNKFKSDSRAVLKLINERNITDLVERISMLEKKLKKYCVPSEKRKGFSVATKVTIIVGVVTIISTLIPLFINDKESMSTKGNYSPIVGSVEHVGDYVEGDKNEIHYHLSPRKAPIKQRIRVILKEINPMIIENIDNGGSNIRVMINVINLQELQQLQKEDNFSNYLLMESTGSVSMGKNNIIGGHINDLNSTGVLHGYNLKFMDKLRNSN